MKSQHWARATVSSSFETVLVTALVTGDYKLFDLSRALQMKAQRSKTEELEIQHS